MSRRRRQTPPKRSAPPAPADAPAVAGLLAVLGALTWVFRIDVAGSDLWWHLAAGRDIWERGQVPTTDPFSHTFAGADWMNHEWLWDVIYWGAYRVDPQLVAWLNLGVIALLLGLLFRLGRRESGSALASGAAVWLFAAASHWFLDIRPHLVTLVLVSVVLLTRRASWAPWLWPPLMAFWVNVHAGFVFGLGTIGLFVLVDTLQRSRAAGRVDLPRAGWLGVAGCLAAWLVNPWGWHIVEYPLAYLAGETPYRTLVEWHTTPFSVDLAYFATRFWLAAAVAAVGAWRIARRDPYLVALALVAFAMGVTSRRFIPLFLVCAIPLIAHGFCTMRDAWTARRPRWRNARAVRIATGAATAATLLLWIDAHPRPDLLTRWTAQREYPDAALTYLQATGAERILNHYAWGGYLMLHAPGLRTYIDGRANTLYSDAFYTKYRRLASGHSLALLEDHPVDAALLQHGPLSRALRRSPRPWRVLYDDATAIVLVPPDSRLATPDADVLLAAHPQRTLSLAWYARSRGDLDEAVALARASLEADPLLLPAYGALAVFLAQQGALDEVAATIARGIASMPRYRERLRGMEGRAYEDVGAYEQALAAYRDAATSGPFLSRESTATRIAALEGKLVR